MYPSSTAVVLTIHFIEVLMLGQWQLTRVLRILHEAEKLTSLPTA